MKTIMTACAVAAGLAMSGCASMSERNVAPAEGAGLNAIAPAVSVAEGAVAGAAIVGLVNAVWADQNNDGFVDGYVQNGNYYAGTPLGYDPVQRRVIPGPPPGTAAAGTTSVMSGVQGTGSTAGVPGVTPAPMTTPTPTPPPAPTTPAARGERG